MARVPQPLFDTFSRFHDLNFLNLSAELPPAIFKVVVA
jgi:hypothetical protein